MSAHTAPLRVGFIGAGKMATALARGLCHSGFTTPDRIVASDVLPAARDSFTQDTAARTVATNVEVAAQSDVLVLAVKPQHFRPVLEQLKPHTGPQHLIVSIAAGIPLATMTAILGASARLVRVMPNTPCLVNASASAYCLGGAATRDDAATVAGMLNAVGLSFETAEPLLDAVTGLSGSGPAYVCVIIEALADGGVRMGLPRDTALKLAAQTVLGTAKMVLESGQHPAALKDAVASPGGTTIAGLHELERGGLRASLMNAVEAATRRSVELGQR
ncbi:MAG: pyrroline-5-carboxylate reductase [Planctomycetes bacterium]|nr:pyrroline-5-carboxylate reductase [Planctomycetota bacterium]